MTSGTRDAAQRTPRPPRRRDPPTTAPSGLGAPPVRRTLDHRAAADLRQRQRKKLLIPLHTVAPTPRAPSRVPPRLRARRLSARTEAFAPTDSAIPADSLAVQSAPSRRIRTADR